MFCRNCGNELMDGAIVCGRCGFAPGNGTSFCPHCGRPVMEGQAICLNCGFSLEPPKSDKSKLAAGLLGLFLGGYGVHNFYLGNTKRAVIQLLLTIFTCGLAGIWGFVEGILILTGASGYQTDSSGRRLQDWQDRRKGRGLIFISPRPLSGMNRAIPPYARATPLARAAAMTASATARATPLSNAEGMMLVSDSASAGM